MCRSYEAEPPKPLQSPYLAILNKQAQIMLKAAAELGFSPSSRSRVQVTADPKDGPFAAMIRRYYDPFDTLSKPWEVQDREPDEFGD
jgi:hypothetical protein